jgi:hypothetical protein
MSTLELVAQISKPGFPDGHYLNYVRNQTKHHDPTSDPDVIALALELEVESVLLRAIENYVRYFDSPSQSMTRFFNRPRQDKKPTP